MTAVTQMLCVCVTRVTGALTNVILVQDDITETLCHCVGIY
jgi:hypothetical protein